MAWFADYSPVYQPRLHYQTQGYPPNGLPNLPQGPSTAAPLLPNGGRVIQNGPVRVLCVADVRGKGKSRDEDSSLTWLPRKLAVPEPACEASKCPSHHSYWRLRLLR